MKISVNVTLATRCKGVGQTNTVRLAVSELDTTCSVKAQVAAVKPIPFPDQDLVLDGVTLERGKTLRDCGVKDHATLDLVVLATEARLVEQIAQLLEERDLSCDELGLLYCYKHGASINQAFKAIGFDGKLEDFVRTQKSLAVVGSRVALVREGTTLKPFGVVNEIEAILRQSETGRLEVKELNNRFVKRFNVSLSTVLGMRPLDYFAKETGSFKVTGRTAVSLVEQATPVPFPLSPEKKLAPIEVPALGDSNQYDNLHDRISSKDFNCKVANALRWVVDTITELCFLNVDHVVRGGAVGKGTAISCGAQAEVIFFLNGLPVGAIHDRGWEPPLLRAVAGILTTSLVSTAEEDEDADTGMDGATHAIDRAEVSGNSVQLLVRCCQLKVYLRFSPNVGSHHSTIEALKEHGPEFALAFQESFSKDRVQFITRQPGQVKVTIRLLKWWRDQQPWSGRISCPSDDILELIAVYAAEQTKPANQLMAIANVMSIMSRFNDLRITWPGFYSREDISEPLLCQRPLLMDPVNPFVNVADPQCFDACELITLAASTHFFW